jgi:ABC-type polysaccharide/polyol phosphate transport system ATPase subunit
MLKELREPKKLINLIRMTLQDSSGKVKIQGQMTEAFGTERGLRKSDPQSTTVCNIVMEKLIMNIKTNQNGTIFNRMRQYVAHAVDVLIHGRSLRANEEVIK